MPKKSKSSKSKSIKTKSSKSKSTKTKTSKSKKTTKSLKINRELLNDVPKEYMNYKHTYGFPPIIPKNNNYEKNVATFGINTKLQDINKILNLDF